MRTITVDQLRDHLNECLAETVLGDVLVTREGKPWVVLKAVSDEMTLDSEPLADSTDFWDLIHQRRQEMGISWDQVKLQLDLD